MTSWINSLSWWLCPACTAVPVPPGTSPLRLTTPPHPSPAQVRLIPQRPGIAFVEYSDERQAGAAMASLQGFKLATDMPLRITFAKQ